MAVAYLYTNFITRENRFANREVLLSAIDNATEKLELEVVGCAITNTSSWVDIKFNRRAPILGEVDKLMYSATYIRATLQAGTYQYLGFIDKVEPDNFNLQGEHLNEQFYRIYFTIDWWSTVMYNDTADTDINAIKHSLEGVVERASVADLEKIDENNIRYLLDYTSQSPEISPVLDIVETEPLTPYVDLDKPLPWLYVVSTRQFKTRAGQAGGYVEYPIGQDYLLSVVGDKEIRCPLYLWAIPIYGRNKAETLPVYLDVHTSRVSGSVSKRIYIGQTLSEENILRDSSIVNMFVSYASPCPVSTIGNRVICDYDYYDNVAWAERIANEVWCADEDPTTGLSPITSSAVFSAYSSNSMFNGGEEVSLVPIAPPSESGTVFKISDGAFDDILLQHREDRNNLRPYTSYDNYINRGISKIHFFPYKYEYINNFGEHILINRAFTTGNLFRYNINPYDGGYIVEMLDELHSKDSKYIYLHNNMAFTPLSTYDKITEQRLVATSTAKQFGVMANTYDMAMSFAQFGIGIGLASVGVPQGVGMAMSGTKRLGGSVAGAVSSMADLIAYEMEADKVRRDGEGGTQKPTSQYGYTFKPLSITYVEPIEEFTKTLKKDLALYGYNTYLHPHELFEDIHIRKYFNFIKTNGAIITKPILNTEIRRYIEEMFDNGVWLWNTYEEFGNYEVPNYQKVILEE